MNNQVSDTDSGEPLVINKNYYVQLPVSIHLINVNNIQLLHLNEINMRFYGAEYNNIEVQINNHIALSCKINE
jgi:hypothetical protein